MEKRIDIKLDWSFLAIVSLIMTVLKINGIINWSWIVVFAPLWIGTIVAIISIIVIVIWLKRKKE